MTDHSQSQFRTVSIHPDLAARLSSLFQRGFRVHARVGCSVTEFLCHQIGIQPDYLQNRIQTIFLDGKAIDAPERSVITNGSTLALSAAMPGLAGATFRKGGKYAALRAGITDTASEIEAHIETGLVTVRLFNFIAAELGPLFLKQGIVIRGKDVENTFNNQTATEDSSRLHFRINDQPVSLKTLIEKLGTHDDILLTLIPE
ncbi:MAG: hypothetical protein WA151_05130 [Desulfatirhabdiaceae bacterium]